MVVIFDVIAVLMPLSLADILFILKGFLAVDNGELSLPEVEEKIFPNPRSSRRF